MSGADVFEEVSASFEILHRECTLQYDSIAARLSEWPVLLTIDGRTLSFKADGSTIVVGKLTAIDAGWVHIGTDSDCIRLVANGNTSLAEAVENPDRALRVRGPIDGVAAAFDSVGDYVDAALRCPDLELKLDRFLEMS